MNRHPLQLRWRGPSRAFLAVTVLAAAFAGLATTVIAQAALSRNAAEGFERKMQVMLEHAEMPQPAVRQTFVSDAEVNSYLRFLASEHIPPGVTEPQVSILDDRRLRGRAVVDLDAVRRARASNGMFDPMNMLTGKLPVTAHGVLRSASGRARFELESAEVGGVPVPRTVLQELVTYYTRSPEHPRGINIDDPFELPARIQEIRLRPGQAVVVQQ
jgi:hypothetical protein